MENGYIDSMYDTYQRGAQQMVESRICLLTPGHTRRIPTKVIVSHHHLRMTAHLLLLALLLLHPALTSTGKEDPSPHVAAVAIIARIIHNVLS